MNSGERRDERSHLLEGGGVHPSIILKNLSIGYSVKHGVRTVASAISESVFPGELTCLLGPNGVGKSTLLRTLSAFQPALSGEILINTSSSLPSHQKGIPSPLSSLPSHQKGISSPLSTGHTPLSTLSPQELSRLIGIVLTEKPDIRSMTVRELVGLGRAPYTGFWGTLTSEDEAIVDDSIRQVGISALSHRFVETLSDGERQKVMIAKALAQQPPVIFLDEPTAFLDFPSKVEVMQLLRRLARDMQKTVFMSTHDLELALQMADRVWLMQRDGLSVGTPQQLADAGTLSRFVERPGIVFDPVALSVRVCKDSSVQ